jgi:phosphoadenosine phosphosulfate reductase
MIPPDLIAAAEDPRARHELNFWLGRMSAVQRVAWALETLPGAHVLSSSFGAQAAAMLHLVTQQRHDIAVILIDTGYLFAETYRFADRLATQLQLNLQVFRPQASVAWMEARHGRLWEQGLDGIERYNRLHKVAPMQQALADLRARTWFAGLRRAQASSRADIDFIELKGERWKVHPIADWSDRDIGQYLRRHALPYHPLWEQGYVSIGDVHTTRPLAAAGDANATRFFGLKRECGLHVEV